MGSRARNHMFATIASRPYQVVDSGVERPDGSVRSNGFPEGDAYSGERDRSFRPIVAAAHEMVLRG